MNLLKRLSVLLLLPLFSVSAQAWQGDGWVADGKGTVVYPSGRTENFEFGFAFEKTFNTYVFKAGKAKMRTDEVPPNYIINAVVNDEGQVYIAEFADGFFDSFELNIGGHMVAIKPRREFDEDEPLKHLSVKIDDMSYLLDSTHPSLRFNFDESGITDIDGNGLIRDLSSRRN